MGRGARLQRKTQELTEQAGNGGAGLTLLSNSESQRCWKTPGSKSKGRKSIFQATSGRGEWPFFLSADWFGFVEKDVNILFLTLLLKVACFVPFFFPLKMVADVESSESQEQKKHEEEVAELDRNLVSFFQLAKFHGHKGLGWIVAKGKNNTLWLYSCWVPKDTVSLNGYFLL